MVAMETETGPRTTDELEAGLDEIRAAPADAGTLEMIVARPAVGERNVVEQGELTLDAGLLGDTWLARGSKHTDDGSSEVNRQVTIMNVRATELVAGPRDRWPLAGDQLYVDFDISAGNLPPGARVRIGAAVVEVSTEPHLGCAKFADRFGMDAVRFVNSPAGKELRLRGINARVVEPGPIRIGDPVTKI